MSDLRTLLSSQCINQRGAGHSPGNTFEVDGSADAGDDPQLVVWAGRRPWVAASKEVMFREQWKAFSIEPQAANVINLRLK